MLKRMMMYGVVVLLAATLVGGTAYILLRQDGARTALAQGFRGTETQALGRGEGGSGGGNRNGGSGGEDGQERGAVLTNRAGDAANYQYRDDVVVWDTISGEVVGVDSEAMVRTSSGDVVVGLGQSWYREEAGFELQIGDQVTIAGFTEDGEFKAGTIENLTSGETLVLRDQDGRPMWSGRGRRAE